MINKNVALACATSLIIAFMLAFPGLSEEKALYDFCHDREASNLIGCNIKYRIHLRNGIK